MRTLAGNRLYERMKQGEPIIGCKLTSRSPLMAELIGYCGYDYVFIDAEHCAYNMETVENAVRATQMGGADAIVRIVDRDPGKILQVLDIGAAGILLPHVEDGAQAAAIVSAAKYYPEGHRGFSDCSRASKFGLVPMEEHRQLSNHHTMMIAMLESKQACDNVEEILDAGIDAITIGRKDLSESMGFGGVINDEVTAVVSQVRAVAKRRGVPLGGSGFEAACFSQRLAEGCTMFNVGSDLLTVKKALLASLAEFQKAKSNYAKEHHTNW